MNTQTTPPVEPGQEYLACAPTPSMPGEHYTRIRVTGMDDLDDTRVRVATVAPYGYLIRHRRIAIRTLHATAFRLDGHRRVTGYRLVQNADGTPAAVSGVR